MDSQPYLPGFHPPFGWVFERLKSCTDIQSSSRPDGYVEWWDEEFSRTFPEGGRVRNVRPVFDRTV